MRFQSKAFLLLIFRLTWPSIVAVIKFESCSSVSFWVLGASFVRLLHCGGHGAKKKKGVCWQFPGGLRNGKHGLSWHTRAPRVSLAPPQGRAGRVKVGVWCVVCGCVCPACPQIERAKPGTEPSAQEAAATDS